METYVIILIAVISIVGKIIEAGKKKDAQKPNPSAKSRTPKPSEELLRRMQEMQRQQEAEAQRQQQMEEPEEDEELDEEEYDDEEEYGDEEQTTYQPVPAPATPSYDVHNPFEHIDSAPGRHDMCAVPLANNLPEEGISSVNARKTNEEPSPLSAIDQPQPVFTAEDMRRAIIYQTILERPKF